MNVSIISSEKKDIQLVKFICRSLLYDLETDVFIEKLKE